MTPAWPKLGADEARWTRRAHQGRVAWGEGLGAWAARHAADLASLRLGRCAVVRRQGLERANLDATWLLQGALGEAPLLLGLDLRLALALLDAHLGREPSPARAERPLSAWEAGFLAARLAAWGAGLAEVGGPRVRASLAPPPSSALKAWARAPLLELELGLALRAGERQLVGALRVWGEPESLAGAWAAPPKPAPDLRAWALGREGLALEVQLAWELRLGAEALGRLAPGGLVVAAALQGPLGLRAGGAWVAQVQRQGAWPQARFVVHQGGPPMSSDPAHAERLARALADASVEVVAELARSQMRLGELAALREGQLLPLAQANPGQVVLRAGDQVLARAELVEVEGALALRVLALGPDKDPAR